MSTHAVPIETCDIRLTGLILPMGLRVESVMVTGRSLTAMDASPWIRMTEPAELVVTVAADDIAQFLEKKGPGGLSRFHIETEDGILRVHAVKRILFEVKAVALCRLRIVEGREIHVDLQSVEVAGGASITELVRSQIGEINPLLDVSELGLPLDMTLVSATPENGKIVVRGRATAP
ncbi:MAG: DUF2993 domain-containing protein [Alphaproteobacteria bacterium]|nr:MAG: DUF2993 domain-containing protein [Alphaproteobacteria bacterium]